MSQMDIFIEIEGQSTMGLYMAALVVNGQMVSRLFEARIRIKRGTE